MKKIFIAMMAVAAFAACSTEEQIAAPKGDAIAFGDAFVDNATKAIDGTFANNGTGVNELTQFNVYGIVKNTTGAVANIFCAEPVSKSGSVWTYDPNKTQYWVAGNSYSFAAVKNGVVAVNDYDMPATIAYDVESQDDVLYAEVNNVNYAGNVQPVKFTFNHLLSKVKFTVKNQMQYGNGNSYKVENVRIVDAVKNATYEIGNTWVSHNNDYELNFGHIVTVGANQEEAALKLLENGVGESNYERLLIPQTNAALTIKVDVKYYVADKAHAGTDVLNDSYTKEIPANLTLEAGKSYNFILTLGNPGEPITFAVENIVDWDEENVVPGVTVVDATNIELYSEEGLRWFAEQVNTGADTFAGKTVKLTSNITMTDGLWTPIGVERAAKSFQGTFDGQNHTISNLIVKSTECAGFFGKNWKGDIKNINFDNATIVGNHYAGVVVAWADGAQNGGANTGWSVENCHVTNSTVTLSVVSNDNGDKAGAIVGYAYAIDVLDCSVATTTVKAYRDLGGIVGILNSNNTHTALVKGCTVGAGVTLVVDNTVNYNNYTEQSQYNVASYAGRINGANSTVDADNSGAATIVF